MPCTYVRNFKPSALFGSEQKAGKNKVSAKINKEYEYESIAQPASGTIRFYQNHSSLENSMSVTVFDACLNTKNSRMGVTKSNVNTPFPYGDDTL